MSDKRTIRNLVEQNKKVYVFTKSEESCRAFLALAETEGFTFDDGVKPTDKHSSDVFSVSADGRISYVGIVGRIAIGSKVTDIEGKKLLKVDFEKYIQGSKEFNIQ